MSARLTPLSPPYAPEVQTAFDAIMPKGVPPLGLFRILAKSDRIYKKFQAGALLDKGSLTLRQREIAILRTCAKTGCAYEWGVHAAFFSSKVGLDETQLKALAIGPADDIQWTSEEQALLMLCDDLNDKAQITDASWQKIRAAFGDEQILELIALAGFYRTVAYFANGLTIPNEPFAQALPT